MYNTNWPICSVCNKYFTNFHALDVHTNETHQSTKSCKNYFEHKLKSLKIEHILNYTSTQYPFSCDFYLPDVDVFIDLHVYWFHNNHFFNANNQNDLQILSNWTNKFANGHKQYSFAIDTWTKKDILKYSIATKYNLNYVVLWTKEEVALYANYLEHLVNI